MKRGYDGANGLGATLRTGEIGSSSSPYVARLLMPHHIEMEACFRLRHRYFVQEKGWVPDNSCSSGLETDVYDTYACHLAVFDCRGVAAYLRALPFDPAVGFMVDHELSSVLSEEQRSALPRDGTLELSRLVLRRDAVGCQEKSGRHPVEHLLRRLYQLSAEHHYTCYLIVVEAGWLIPFRRRFGLPFRPLGEPHIFPDGTRTVGAVATREELEEGVRRHSPALYDWYQASAEEVE